MTSTRIIIDRDFTVGPVDPRLFGSFAEHLGRCIYGGLYEPGHPTADASGFRQDVLALVQELGVTVVRYPGGNFVSGYRWEDGVGPRELRPRRREIAWTSIETNHFGTDEFIDWCRAAKVQPLLAVNLGTRGPAEAGDYAEYCNQPAGMTTLGDQRVANGHPEPHGVTLWCLGNEVDGWWQQGAKTAVEYGRIAREAAKLMTIPSGGIENSGLAHHQFIACGSSGADLPTFGAWEREVLEECYDHVHYVSLHTYYNNFKNDVPTFLASSALMADQIRKVVATCDAVQARRKSKRRIDLCFDEWNIWYHSRDQDARQKPWTIAPPLLEDVYDAADALVVGGMLISLLNHADRVRIACLAQLVNVIGPIMTRTGGPAWRQTIFHPFALTSRHGRGTALQTKILGSTYACEAGEAIPLVDAAAVATATGGVNIFILHRDLKEFSETDIDLRGFGPLAVEGWEFLHADDLTVTNREADPDRYVPQIGVGATVVENRVHVRLPPGSWSVLRLVPADLASKR